MKGFNVALGLLAMLVAPVSALAQGQLSAEVEPMADKIECPLDELEWGIAQSFPDPWYSDPEVSTEPWYPGYLPTSLGPYTSTWMGKEMLACRWSDHEERGSLRVQRPWADIPEENYPCPPTVKVKVLSSLPSPWLGTTYTWSLITKHTGAGNTINYCHYEGQIPNEILRPVRTEYPEFSANPPPSINDFKQVFAVTGAVLAARTPKKTTNCPTTVRFAGLIRANGPGQVRFRVEKDGQLGAVHTLDFVRASGMWGRVVEFETQVDAPQPEGGIASLTTQPQPSNVVTGQARIVIESPPDGVSESNLAKYEITCSMAPVGGLAQTPEKEEPEPLGIAAPQQPPHEATPQIQQAAPQPKPIVEGGENEMIHKKPTRGAAPAPANNALQAVVLLPDLRIRTAMVDPSKPKEVKVRVANTGQAASAATRVRVWVIPQGHAWYGVVPPIAAGQDAWTTIQADMPVMVAQHVYARVDDPDKNKESDEGNNGHQLK